VKKQKGYFPKDSYSFYRFKSTQKRDFDRSFALKFRNENERVWNESYQLEKANNAILRMDMLMLRDRLKPFTNEGFNHVDRRRSKGAKIWVMRGKDRPDQ
jgi:hypothetical protein